MLTSLREKKKRRTRADILAAAAECFERTGYRNANMRDIAAAADVAYQTLYNYFPSKAGVALALLEREGEARVVSDADVVDALKGLGRVLTARVADGDIELWREAALEIIRGERIPIIRRLEHGIDGHLRDTLAAAQQRGRLDAYLDLDAMAAVIESILGSALLDAILSGDHDDSLHATDDRIEVVLKPYLRGGV